MIDNEIEVVLFKVASYIFIGVILSFIIISGKIIDIGYLVFIAIFIINFLIQRRRK